MRDNDYTEANVIINNNSLLLNKVITNIIRTKKYLSNKDILLESKDLYQEIYSMLIESINKDVFNNINTDKYTRESSLTNICRFLINNYIRKFFSQKRGTDCSLLFIEDVTEDHFASFFNASGFKQDFSSLLKNLELQDTELDQFTLDAYKMYYREGFTVAEVAVALLSVPSEVHRRMQTNMLSFVDSLYTKTINLKEIHSA